MARPWETPCANRSYTAHFGILVDPWRLDEGAVTGIIANVEWDPNERRYVVVQA